ncbi:endonuclease I, partial [Psychromonas aquatilis]
VCVNTKRKAYKGRRCAEKANMEYLYMQADMYNLYPAIGSVNDSRSNFNLAMLGDSESDFGSSAMKIENRK